MAQKALVPETIALRYRGALEECSEEIASVADEDLVDVKADIPFVVMRCVGAAPRIRALRDEIVEAIPRFDTRCVDKLEIYALAAGQAQADLAATAAPPEVIEAKVSRLSELRQTFTSDAAALARRGRIDGSKLKELRGTTGHLNILFDVLTLTSLFRANWAVVDEASDVQLSELEEAEALATEVTRALGAREMGPSATSAARKTRDRAWTLLVMRYDEARDAIVYVRRKHGDAEEIAPSIYAGRATSRAKAAEGNTAPTAPSPVAPAPVAPAQAPVGRGLPGEDPFSKD